MLKNYTILMKEIFKKRYKQRHTMFKNWKIQHNKDISSLQNDIQDYVKTYTESQRN